MCHKNTIVTEAKYLRDTIFTFLINGLENDSILIDSDRMIFYSHILSSSNMQHFYEASTLCPVLCCYDSWVCKDFFCVSIIDLNWIELVYQIQKLIRVASVYLPLP